MSVSQVTNHGVSFPGLRRNDHVGDMLSALPLFNDFAIAVAVDRTFFDLRGDVVGMVP
ncbi:hypothetical protein NKH57_02265 [Mesorhizobium sp. M1050]|uniref:hypothetical protein n=1 Tax=unclassified Mesorhizobium TaxID=325217 RepID=UPI00333D1382